MGNPVRKIRKRLRALQDKWVRPSGLGWWTIHFYYYKTRKQYEKTTGCDGHGGAAYAHCDWAYREASIYFNLPILRKLTDEAVEHVFVHELMHVLVDELARAPKADRQRHLERVCQTLADAMIWSHGVEKTG